MSLLLKVDSEAERETVNKHATNPLNPEATWVLASYFLTITVLALDSV